MVKRRFILCFEQISAARLIVAELSAFLARAAA